MLIRGVTWTYAEKARKTRFAALSFIFLVLTLALLLWVMPKLPLPFDYIRWGIEAAFLWGYFGVVYADMFLAGGNGNYNWRAEQHRDVDPRIATLPNDISLRKPSPALWFKLFLQTILLAFIIYPILLVVEVNIWEKAIFYFALFFLFFAAASTGAKMGNDHAAKDVQNYLDIPLSERQPSN